VSSIPNPPQGAPGYYRERAADMLKKAEEAGTEESRNSYLLLAASWGLLAQKLEHRDW
jgi:hypothetical protein